MERSWGNNTANYYPLQRALFSAGARRPSGAQMGPKGAVRGRFKPITIIPYILKFGENPLTPQIFKFQIQSSP
jgi:hypothetical protein